MIEADKRKAIETLHREGMSIRDISTQLRIGRNTVRRILKGKNKDATLSPRQDRIEVDPELLGRLFVDCDGWVQRVREKLQDQGIEIGYSTLTRLIRAQGLGETSHPRSDQVADEPGAEIQHDTSPYRVDIGAEKVAIIASLLYYRYCKQRYLRFYRAFNRFQMKAFFHEAMTHFKYTCPVCVIDNTNLAVLHGTGKNAVFVPEMVAFGKSYGFDWLAHEKGHSDRKAGEERSFWTVETNFFPGRKFASLEDLNEQARNWALVIMAKRPQTDIKIIPDEWFEREKPYLKKIPPYVPEPYQEHQRGVDQYGRTPFDGNHYWVPGTGRGEVKILQYPNRIRIYRNRELLIEYPLPAYGVKHKRFKPPGVTEVASPSLKASASDIEEEKLRKIAPEVATYLEFAATKALRGQKPRWIRELYRLHTRMADTLFIQTLIRATTYRVTDLQAIERIAVFLLRDDLFDVGLPESTAKFQSRDLYREGRLSADPDFSIYQKLLEVDDEPGAVTDAQPEVKPATDPDDDGNPNHE